MTDKVFTFVIEDNQRLDKSSNLLLPHVVYRVGNAAIIGCCIITFSNFLSLVDRCADNIDEGFGQVWVHTSTKLSLH